MNSRTPSIILNALLSATISDWLFAALFGVGLWMFIMGLYRSDPSWSRLMLILAGVCLSIPCLCAGLAFENATSQLGAATVRVAQTLLLVIVLTVGIMSWVLSSRVYERVMAEVPPRRPPSPRP